ncbi:HAD family hydrolase [Rhizobium sp. SG741]|uniref:HAD family hydrolase n=1 Tax=Rhizobium sp. SG741 TaxID=2587114 RepID=UPI00144722F4|nr:HAD family hydrolase [Rhizobium sp. SG741]NKJ07905.1 FMN phosphatase YigB (HAD superfamily) [Rhizobium sp. SG741]
MMSGSPTPNQDGGRLPFWVCEASACKFQGTKMIKAVLFDLDETLLDRRAAAVEFLALQYCELVAGQFGDALSQDQYAARYLKLEEQGLVKKSDLYPTLVASFGLPGELSGPLLDHFRLRCPEMACPMNGAREALQFLRKVDLFCATISNGEGVVHFSLKFRLF